MKRDRKNLVPETTEERADDPRERFVLRGGGDIAESAPAEPEAHVDLEEALRKLGDPERSRTRARRQSAL